ncbi:hypothetical protein [Fusibacter ferrireducens]|uniref:DUF4142 domain-containing protein n=1 Tax=Fusibacter ferrireducens TaxID=2785058 RepID=A0ABR9ZW11_9FIRM|nr:hypothetical protein [Fusibacter ferrireducens]MBF4694625.1 hypothetical protein [Fusibacter ferrireducens]
MKKEFIKKIVTLGLLGTMIVPALAFADNSSTDIAVVPEDKPTVNRPIKGDLPPRPENENGRMPMRDDRGPQLGDRSLEIVTLYAPELLDQFETAMDSQKSIRDSISTLQKTKLEANQTAYRALLNTLKAGLENGTITRAEAQTQLEAFKTSGQAERDALRTEIEALKDTYKIDQEAHRTLMTTLKTAIDSSDEATIKASLNTLLEQLNQHIQYDQALYELFSSK